MYKYLLFIYLFFSCSQLELVDLSFNNFRARLKGVCLNGTGKGRIESGSDKYLFDYDTLLKGRDHWVMGVEIPLRGEEDFQIFRSGKSYSFKGSFYRQISSSYRGKKLEVFLNFLAHNIFMFQKFKNINDAKLSSYFKKWCGSTPVKKCTFEQDGLQYELTSISFKVWKKLKNHTLMWENFGEFDDTSNTFSRSYLSLKKGDKKVLATHFFHSSCQSETTWP